MQRIDPFITEVRARLLHELDGLNARRLTLRLDQVGERSAFVMGEFDDGAVMVARVYEDDLGPDRLVLRPVYLTSEDASLLAAALTAQPVRRELAVDVRDKEDPHDASIPAAAG